MRIRKLGDTLNPGIKITFPIEIIQTDKISPMAKLVFGVLYSSCDPIEKDVCNQWTPETLTKLFNTTAQNIYKIILALEEEKLVLWVRKNTENEIKRSFKKHFKIKRSFKKMQKAEYSNNINYEVINGITNINNNKDNINNLSNDYTKYNHSFQKNLNTKKIKEQFKKSTTPKKETTTPINPLLVKLFSLPNIPKHRHNTQLYNKTVTFFNLLRKGELFKKSVLDKNWLLQFDIPEKLINQQWQEAQIIKVFENISKAYTHGFEPADKKTLPKSFIDILYNPRSHKSLFLKTAASGRIRAVVEKQIDNKKNLMSPLEKEMLNSLSKTIIKCYKEKNKKLEIELLIHIIPDFINFYDCHIKQFNAPISAFSFFKKDYCQWVFEEYEGRLNSVAEIKKNSTCWFRYIKSRGFNG